MNPSERLTSADLMADVTLYSTVDGGRETAIRRGYGCPCMISKQKPLVGWDARLLLGEHRLEPGERRQLGFVFLTSEGLQQIRAAGRFYLWEGRFIGEAVVLNESPPSVA